MQTGVDTSSIAEKVADAIRGFIVDGRLADGASVNEARLAAELAVSRTPLREALNRLVAEGAVEARARRGFFIRPLTVADFKAVYPIRALLDPEALRLAGLPSTATIDELEAMNGALRAAASPVEAIALDDAWHLRLLRDCPNPVLVELIRLMMARTRRYETALFRETRKVFQTTDEHAHILAALRDGDLARACAALKRNCESGCEPILEWLRARGRNEKGSSS